MAHPSSPGWLVPLLGLTALGLFLLNFSIYLDRLLHTPPQELYIDIERRAIPLPTPPEPPTTRFHLHIYPAPHVNPDRSPRRFEFRRLPHHPNNPRWHHWKPKHVGQPGVHSVHTCLPLDEHDAQTFVLLNGRTISPQP